MNDIEKKTKIRPFYSELQGYLSQAPTPTTPQDIIDDEAMWNHYNGLVDILSETYSEGYSRFKVNPTRDEYSSFIRISTYRQKLGGLISRLHGEYFFDEPPPFSGMPHTVITQTQQQNVSVQMLLDIQTVIDKQLTNTPENSKETGFLKKLKSMLSSVTNVNDFIRQCMKLAKEFGLTVQDILALWGG